MAIPIYHAEINEEREIPIFEGDLDNLDVVQRADGTYHILFEGRSYRFQVENVDLKKKVFRIKSGTKEIRIHLRNSVEELVHKMGLEEAAQSHVDQIIAPMPGLVLDVRIQVGEGVEKGDALIILEAMKMENVIAAPNDGIIKEVLVKVNDPVEKDQVLVILE